MSSAALVACGNREHHAHAGLLVGRQHGVDSGVVLRHHGEEILDGGDAVAQRLGGAEQRAQPYLAQRAVAVVAGIGVQRPDVEGHLLEQALRQHVMGVIVRVHHAGDDELAPGVDHLDAGLRRNRGRDALDRFAIDQKVGDRRLMHVAIVIVDAPAADQVTRLCHFTHPALFGGLACYLMY